MNPKTLFSESFFKKFTNAKFLVSAIILAAWLALQLRLGAGLYIWIAGGLILTVFLIPRRAYGITAAAILLLVLLNTNVVGTLETLKEASAITAADPEKTLSRIFTPGSGREAFPREVQHMLTLLDKHVIANYRLSESFANDAWIDQRITEGAWPLKQENSSPYIFSSLAELDHYPDCAVIDQIEDISLAYCD